MIKLLKSLVATALFAAALVLPASANTTFTSLYSPIKSVQRGTIAIGNNVLTGTSTITSVTTSKAELILLGLSYNQGATWAASGALVGSPIGRLSLTNSTTVTLDRDVDNSTGSTTLTASYQVVEYN